MKTIDELIAGYHRFQQGYYADNRERLRKLATEGQSPLVCVVSCSDSRVDPIIITDSTPGDMFVIRNVANLVPPHEGGGTRRGTSAALEFAVQGLNVRHIIVLGHAMCGGIRSLVERGPDAPDYEYIGPWMDIAKEARAQVLAREDLPDTDARAHACEVAALGVSLKNLMSFSWVADRVAQGKLYLHAWHYDIHSGELKRYEPEDGTLHPLG